VRVLVPAAGRLDAVVLGGDRRALDEVMADQRLAPLRALVADRVLDVPDPRLAVLRDTPELFLATIVRPSGRIRS
jgi:VLRF1 release factor-like protein